MSWRNRWVERNDGRYEYHDPSIDITYTIGSGFFDQLSELSDDGRDEIMMIIMTQAADTIAHSAIGLMREDW